MLKKLLSTFGIGSAKIDTHLEQASCMPGEEIRGEAQVIGGGLAQNIDDIYINVTTQYLRKVKRNNYVRYQKVTATIAHYKIAPAFSIQPKETRSFPFSINLPPTLPLSVMGHPVYIRTGLNIDYALDPTDADLIDVKPLPLMQKVFDAVQALGFYFHSNKCDHYRKNRWKGKYPFLQKFEFKATAANMFKDKVDRIEIIFDVNTVDDIKVIVVVDKRESGAIGLLKEILSLDEYKSHFQATTKDLEQPPEYWTNLLVGYVNDVIK